MRFRGRRTSLGAPWRHARATGAWRLFRVVTWREEGGKARRFRTKRTRLGALGCRGGRTTRLRVAGAITCARFGREEAPRKEEEEERVAIITNIIIIINNNNNNSGD